MLQELPEKINATRQKIKNRQGFLSANQFGIVALKSDGTVLTAGDLRVHAGWVGKFKNIISVQALLGSFVVLKPDGTFVMSTGDGSIERYYRGVKRICVDGSVFAAIAEGGSVQLVRGYSSYISHLNEVVAAWRNIVDISIYDSKEDGFIAGLKKNGTVVVAGETQNIDVSNWTNIISIIAHYNEVIGLKQDGTLISTRGFVFNRTLSGDDMPRFAHIKKTVTGFIGIEVGNIVEGLGGNIVDIETFGHEAIVGLRADGTCAFKVLDAKNEYKYAEIEKTVKTFRDIGPGSIYARAVGNCLSCNGKIKGFFGKKCELCGTTY